MCLRGCGRCGLTTVSHCEGTPCPLRQVCRRMTANHTFPHNHLTSGAQHLRNGLRTMVLSMCSERCHPRHRCLRRLDRPRFDDSDETPGTAVPANLTRMSPTARWTRGNGLGKSDEEVGKCEVDAHGRCTWHPSKSSGTVISILFFLFDVPKAGVFQQSWS